MCHTWQLPGAVRGPDVRNLGFGGSRDAGDRRGRDWVREEHARRRLVARSVKAPLATQQQERRSACSQRTGCARRVPKLPWYAGRTTTHSVQSATDRGRTGEGTGGDRLTRL